VYKTFFQGYNKDKSLEPPSIDDTNTKENIYLSSPWDNGIFSGTDFPR